MTLNDASRQLAQVLRTENDLLRAGDADGAARLLPQKQRAAQALRDALPGSSPDAEWAGLLRALAEENRTLLHHAMDVQARILEMVARAARSAAPGPVGYGARGALRPGTARSSIGAMAMALRA
jgi:hypothetical protein